MKRRTWLVLLVSISIGIPVILELLTLVGMIQIGFSSEPRRDTLNERAIDRRPDVGDPISLGDDRILIITRLGLRARTNPWSFRLTFTLENRRRKPLFFESRRITLKSGRTIKIRDQYQVSPGERRKETLNIPISSGNEPVSWTFRWREGKDGSVSPSTSSTISLPKVPIRRSEREQ